MSNAETTAAPNTVTVEIDTSAEPRAFTRERRYARGSNGGAVSMSISRNERTSGHTVAWNANRGAGWSKGWKATRATEAEAFAFAGEKWPTLVAWLGALVPVDGGGAAAAFSAQIAGMR